MVVLDGSRIDSTNALCYDFSHEFQGRGGFETRPYEYRNNCIQFLSVEVFLPMLIRNLKDCAEFISGDGCVLREILHPDKMDLKLGYSLAHAIVHPGDITLPHRLKTSEVYYIIEGEGIMHIDEETAPVRAGATIYIPPKAVQFIQNSGKNGPGVPCHRRSCLAGGR